MIVLILILVLALLVAIAAVVFAIGNPGVITVHFLAWSFDSSLTFLLLAAFVPGFVLGWLVTVPSSIKKSLTIAGHKKKIESLEKQVPPKVEAPAKPKVEAPARPEAPKAQPEPAEPPASAPPDEPKP